MLLHRLHYFWLWLSHCHKWRTSIDKQPSVSDLDDLRGAFADGVKQWLLDALEVDSVEQQFDGFHRLAVDGQVQSAAAHVVDAVDVQRDLVRLLEGLANDWNVAEGRRVQVDALLVR